jgi:hypothetical protein
MERKRDEDLADIEARIRQVEVERAYRVIGVLEKRAKHIENVIIPTLIEARRKWRRKTAWFSGTVIGLIVAAFLYVSTGSGLWQGFTFTPLAGLDGMLQAGVVAGAAAVLLLLHLQLRRIAGRRVLRKLEKDDSLGADRDGVLRAFSWNVRAWWHSLASERPRGWNGRRRRQLNAVLADADALVQSLNDRYATPSGKPGD